MEGRMWLWVRVRGSAIWLMSVDSFSDGFFMGLVTFALGRAFVMGWDI
jgi:hypothetical protein